MLARFEQRRRGFFADHLGGVHMALGRFVERRADHLAMRMAAEIRDFLRPLVDEQQDELCLGAVVGNGVGDVLQQDGLAGARRRDDQSALAEADRREHIHHAHRHVLMQILRFEQNTFERIIERTSSSNGVTFEMSSGLPPMTFSMRTTGRAAFVALAGLLHDDLDLVAALQTVVMHEAFRHIGIFGIQSVIDALVHHEAKASVGQIEPAAVTNLAFGLRHVRKNLREKLLAIGRVGKRGAEIAGERGQLRQRERVDLVEKNRLALAGGNFIGQPVKRARYRQSAPDRADRQTRGRNWAAEVAAGGSCRRACRPAASRACHACACCFSKNHGPENRRRARLPRHRFSPRAGGMKAVRLALVVVRPILRAVRVPASRVRAQKFQPWGHRSRPARTPPGSPCLWHNSACGGAAFFWLRQFRARSRPRLTHRQRRFLGEYPCDK